MKINTRIFVLLSLFLSLAAKIYPSWVANVIDTSADTIDMALLIDSNGFAHVSYYTQVGAMGSALKYSSYNGTGWEIQTVLSSFGPGGPGFGSSIVEDSAGYIHIIHGDDSTFQLRHSIYNGTGWTQDFVMDSLGYNTSSVIDSNGYLNLSFSNESDQLSFAVYNGSNWNIQTVDSSATYFASLDLDSNGYAHISYYDETTTDLRYSFYNGTGWVKQTVDSVGNTGYFNSISIDSSGYIHVSYYDSSNGDLKYAFYNGTGWTKQTVDSSASESIGKYTSIMVDSNGRPYISYVAEVDSGTSYNLNLAYFNGTGWEIQVVATNIYTEGGYPRESSLALYNDYVYITYANSSGDLSIITNAPSGFVEEPGLNILALIIFVLVFWSIVHKKAISL